MTAWALLAVSLTAYQASSAPMAPPLAGDDAGVTVTRDAYGVPTILAPTDLDAMEALGASIAQDRLWQMELSRRSARGRLSQILGASAVASDTEVLQLTYTDSEYLAQFQALPVPVQRRWEAYVRGVNRTITDRIAQKTLPPEYARYGFQPAPWTILDSCAIAVRLAWQFGNGGAGELRNLAALLYLRAQPIKDRALDAMDDLSWVNDPSAPVTVARVDDPFAANPPRFPRATRAQTLAHLALLPPANLLELAPAVRLGERESSTRLAMELQIPYKSGSYAVVVSPQRSRTGHALLLGGPQMGHSAPSPVYEFAYRAGQDAFAGMTVPGVPGPILGSTPTFAWTLTSGVADVVDIFFNLKDGENVRYGTQTEPLQTLRFALPVKDQDVRTVVQSRTRYGPVLLNSRAGNVVYSQRRSYAGQELAGFAAVWDLVRARRVRDVDAAHARIGITFNLFFAFSDGNVGYRYCGWMPLRAPGLDPRLPTPGDGQHDWRGVLPAAQMPRADNPRDGLLVNWNNKPVAWWDNGDTPVWGERFRVRNLQRALPAGRLGISDLEDAVRLIAEADEDTQTAFLTPLLQALAGDTSLTPIERDAAQILRTWDGAYRDGSQGAVLYLDTWRALRRGLFEPLLGQFLGTGTFETVVQPSVVARALRGQTRVNYLGKSTATDAWRTAFRNAVGALQARTRIADPGEWRYQSATIRFPGQPPMPYRNRGTYLQLVELRPYAVMRTVAGPGSAESGAHAEDQIPLMRAWGYKPQRIPR